VEKCPKLLQTTALGDDRRDVAGVVRGGVEPPTHGFSVREETGCFPGNTAFSANPGANAVAVETKPAHISPDLQAVIDRWSNLPDAIKAGILAMVAAASQAAR
jgi:hypothetical protein